jgi:poly(3-hydroxybutyrate) depolymerase
MRSLVLVLVGLLLAPFGVAASYVSIDGAACVDPPLLRCPVEGCPADRVIHQGPVVEMKTRRSYFLDYPCDLAPGEPVTFVLNLHGGGSYGNWQRHYFPLVDHVGEYRLVVATPNSPIRVWTEADDEYLRNIVDFVVGELGAENIGAFWLAGHSQGGMTSNRILRSSFFQNRADGWISLSGGRLGGNPGRADDFGPPPVAAAAAAPPSAEAQARARMMGEMFARAATLLDTPPDNDISFIYTTGEREVDGHGVPADSAHARQLDCGPRSAPRRVDDTTGGYVYDPSRQDPPTLAWGLLPGPGSADIYTFPGCRDGRVVADVVRRDKGHTEGLEPQVTRALIELMLAAPGGRIRAQADREAAAPIRVPGVACRVPALHCPDADCPVDVIAQRGNATDLLTGRNFFLDYPCDLEPGEAVTFVLNLHGGGSIGNWQRHFFPLMDFTDPYRLIVATPSGVVRAWVAENDDEHLRNIVDYVYDRLAAVHIRAFWLAGHSQGGQTSNRLINEGFFGDRLSGWVSIAGGRLGSERSEIRAPIPRGTPPPGGAELPPGPMRLAAHAEELPTDEFSHIYVTGEHEIPVEKHLKLPEDSPWAEKLGCGPRERRADVVDTRPGYVYDTREQPDRSKVWGLNPRPGTAEVYVFPGCRNDRLVADVVRLDKGHTEGLEPRITEAIVRLMLSAP